MRVNLTKKEIINSVFMQIGFSRKMSESILEDILTDIVKNLKKHKVVKISNFGTFHIRFKKKRVGRNPKTKEEKIIKDLGNIIQAYQEVARRLGIMPEETNISEVKKFAKTTSIKFLFSSYIPILEI